MNKLDIKVRLLPKGRWSLEMASVFYGDHPLNEIVQLAGKQLRPLNGIEMDFYVVEVSIDNTYRGVFGPIESKIAEGVNEVSKQSSFISIEEFITEAHHRAVSSRTSHLAKVIGTVTCAIQDAEAKRKGQSVAEMLLGDTVSLEVPCYASMITVDIDSTETTNIARALTKLGFWGQKWHLSASTNEERTNLLIDLKRVERLRSAIGSNDRLMLEVHGRWTPHYLEKFIYQCRDFNITWIEDPLTESDSSDYRTFNKSDIPICIGEKFSSLDEYISFISEESSFVIQADFIDCGGYEVVRRVQRLCADNSKLMTLHGKRLIPSLHVAATAPPDLNQVIEFNPIFEPERQYAMQQRLIPDQGYLKFFSNNWDGLWQRRS